MGARAAGGPTDKTGPVEPSVPASQGLKKIPKPGRAAPVGRPSKPVTRQQTAAARTVKAAIDSLEKALSTPAQPKQRKVVLQKEAAPRRFQGAKDAPFVVPKKPKFTAADAENLAKNYTIVGSKHERRIVHVNDRTFGDKIRHLFQNRIAALQEFAQAKNLTPEEMNQLPQKIKAATQGLKNKESVAQTINWISNLAKNEKAALVSAVMATMKHDITLPLHFLKAAIDGTEPLSETIDKELGRQPDEQKKEIVQNLIDGILLQCKNNPQDNIWKLRLQHLLGQYLLMSTGLQNLSTEEREALAGAYEPADFLMKRLSFCPKKTVENLSSVLNTTKKTLLLALIAETQKPSYTDWPDMANLLITTEAWTAEREKNSALDKLAGKLFP